MKTELYFADDEATKVAELRKFRLTKKLALVEAEKKAIDEVEESEFSDENKFTPPVDINMINKDELVRKYLRSQASCRTECSISTVETYISGKSKIVPPKSFSKSCLRVKINKRIRKSKLLKSLVTLQRNIRQQ